MVNIHSYLQLIRPFNCLMGSLGVFIAALIGAGLTIVDFWRDAVLSLVVVFIFMAGANALNDYYDRLTDKINHPDRPIPSKKISPRNALDFGFIALFIAFILSVFINFTALLIVCIAAILILFYELHFKNRGFVGNVIISLLVGFLFIFGGSVVKSYDLNLMIAFMAFFATLSREIVKDIQDIEGDVDRITLPKKIGIRPAGTAAAVFIMIAVIVSPLPYFPSLLPPDILVFDVGPRYLVLVAVADVIFIRSAMVINRNPGKAQSYLKYGMFVALIAFLAAALL